MMIKFMRGVQVCVFGHWFNIWLTKELKFSASRLEYPVEYKMQVPLIISLASVNIILMQQ